MWKTMADRLADRGDNGRGHGGWVPARAGTGRISKGVGLMRMLGGDSTGEATGSAAADRVRNALREAACPAEEAPN